MNNVMVKKNNELDDHENSLNKRTLYSQRYKTFKNLDQNVYSKKILTSFFGDPVSNPKYLNSVPYFQVVPYCNLWADFIYSDKSVHYFDKALTTEKSLLQKYRSLFAASRGAVNLAATGSDKLLVSYPMELFYGFQTFDGISRLLNKIYTCDASATETLNYSDFQGLDMFMILKLLKDTPLVYNRHLLIYFACEAITSGTLSDSRYLNVDSKSTMHYVGPSAKSRNSQKQTCIALMEDFLLHINTIIIPLIFDLWDYIISQINNTFDNLVDTKMLRNYIDTYYPLITADWTAIPLDKMPKKDIELLKINEMNHFRTTLMQVFSENTYPSEQLEFIIPKYNVALRSQMSRLLQFYCNPNQIPSLIYTPKDIVKPLYFLLTPSAFEKSPEQIVLNQFRLDHAKFIYQLSTNSNVYYNED